jgi:uncharacterized FlgJ-related protein
MRFLIPFALIISVVVAIQDGMTVQHLSKITNGTDEYMKFIDLLKSIDPSNYKLNETNGKRENFWTTISDLNSEETSKILNLDKEFVQKLFDDKKISPKFAIRNLALKVKYNKPLSEEARTMIERIKKMFPSKDSGTISSSSNSSE